LPLGKTFARKGAERGKKKGRGKKGLLKEDTNHAKRGEKNSTGQSTRRFSNGKNLLGAMVEQRKKKRQHANSRKKKRGRKGLSRPFQGKRGEEKKKKKEKRPARGSDWPGILTQEKRERPPPSDKGGEKKKKKTRGPSASEGKRLALFPGERERKNLLFATGGGDIVLPRVNPLIGEEERKKKNAPPPSSGPGRRKGKKKRVEEATRLGQTGKKKGKRERLVIE